MNRVIDVIIHTTSFIIGSLGNKRPVSIYIISQHFYPHNWEVILEWL